MPQLSGRFRFLRAAFAFVVFTTSAALAPAAHAQLLFSLTPADVTAAPGDTITFTGTLTNRFTSTIFLNGFTGGFTQSGAGTVDTSSFFNFVPESLASGATYSGNIFSATLASNAVNGTTYNGVVNIQGGSDAGAQQMLAFQNFSVTASSAVTPAPPAGEVFALLGGAGFVFGLVRQRGKKRTASAATVAQA